jgi:hypothetical protein
LSFFRAGEKGFVPNFLNQDLRGKFMAGNSDETYENSGSAKRKKYTLDKQKKLAMVFLGFMSC